MKNRLHTVLFLAAGFMGAWIGSAWQRSYEPRFHGQRLSVLVREMTAHPVHREKLLAEIGPALVPYLLPELDRPGYGSTGLSFQLGCFVYRTAPAWIRAYWPEPVLDSERRLNAVILLGQMGTDAKAAVPKLNRLLADQSVRDSAVNTLAAIGPSAKPALPRLLMLLEDESAPFVCSALPRILTNPNEVIAILRRFETNGASWIQREASAVLRQLGAAESSVACLLVHRHKTAP